MPAGTSDEPAGLPGPRPSALETVALQGELERLRAQVLRGQLERRRSGPHGAFENSPGMKAIKGMIDQVADTDATVLVWGESGVGKELVARAIHESSPRREHACVKVNCAALPPSLLESELFGHERGAFTGAHERRAGKFELADGGTIFLDEIGEMPLSLQAKLLHVLQDREFARLGGGHDIAVDVRVVASTNKDLQTAIVQGGFREDLYYRLNVVNIHVPPLRERPEEIPILAEHFWQKYSQQYNRERLPLSRELLERFRVHAWPGNVRELENLVKRLIVLGSEEWIVQALPAPGTADTIEIGQPETPSLEPLGAEGSGPRPAWVPGVSLKDFTRRVAQRAERVMMKRVLEEVRGNRVEAGRRLKISYKAVLYKIRQYGLADSGR
jgi:transcriptional regulator with GAF, ATPase, and Fis domain